MYPLRSIDVVGILTVVLVAAIVGLILKELFS